MYDLRCVHNVLEKLYTMYYFWLSQNPHFFYKHIPVLYMERWKVVHIVWDYIRVLENQTHALKGVDNKLSKWFIQLRREAILILHLYCTHIKILSKLVLKISVAAKNFF